MQVLTIDSSNHIEWLRVTSQALLLCVARTQNLNDIVEAIQHIHTKDHDFLASFGDPISFAFSLL
jgi:hypothetical protein